MSALIAPVRPPTAYGYRPHASPPSHEPNTSPHAVVGKPKADMRFVDAMTCINLLGVAAFLGEAQQLALRVLNYLHFHRLPETTVLTFTLAQLTDLSGASEATAKRWRKKLASCGFWTVTHGEPRFNGSAGKAATYVVNLKWVFERAQERPSWMSDLPPQPAYGHRATVSERAHYEPVIFEDNDKNASTLASSGSPYPVHNEPVRTQERAHNERILGSYPDPDPSPEMQCSTGEEKNRKPESRSSEKRTEDTNAPSEPFVSEAKFLGLFRQPTVAAAPSNSVGDAAPSETPPSPADNKSRLADNTNTPIESPRVRLQKETGVVGRALQDEFLKETGLWRISDFDAQFLAEFSEKVHGDIPPEQLPELTALLCSRIPALIADQAKHAFVGLKKRAAMLYRTVAEFKSQETRAYADIEECVNEMDRSNSLSKLVRLLRARGKAEWLSQPEAFAFAVECLERAMRMPRAEVSKGLKKVLADARRRGDMK